MNPGHDCKHPGQSWVRSGAGQHEWEEGAGRQVDEAHLEFPAWASQDEGAMDSPLLRNGD